LPLPLVGGKSCCFGSAFKRLSVSCNSRRTASLALSSRACWSNQLWGRKQVGQGATTWRVRPVRQGSSRFVQHHLGGFSWAASASATPQRAVLPSLIAPPISPSAGVAPCPVLRPAQQLTPRTFSKLPKGTVTAGGSRTQSGSLPRRLARLRLLAPTTPSLNSSAPTAHFPHHLGIVMRRLRGAPGAGPPLSPCKPAPLSESMVLWQGEWRWGGGVFAKKIKLCWQNSA
jgi:hypothetical protein